MGAPSPMGYVDEGGIAYAGGYGELIDALLEYVPDLLWPLSVRTYSRMRWDPQLRAVLSAYTLPIRRATWAVDGSGCNPAVTADAALQLGLPILGQDAVDTTGARRRGVVWGKHLRLALLKLTFGHMPFERVYDTSTGTKATLASLPERMPQTIAMIDLNQDGSLKSITQNALAGAAAEAPKQPVIPAKNLVWYSHDQEGSAWSGQSLLRSAYSPWLIKHELWRVHATSVRRFGMGIMEVQAPPGATQNQLLEAQRLAAGYRAGDTAGVGLPAGFTSALKGMTGTAPDALGFINYLDKQMTRATLTSLLDMTDTTHGSRALGETFMDLFLLALQAIADDTAEQATSQLVVPLVDLNYGEQEPAPRIVCGDVGSQHEVTAQTLQLLMSSGALSADPALEEYVRREYKLPARETPWVAPHTGMPVPDPASTYPPGAVTEDGTSDDVIPEDTGAQVAAAAGGPFTGAYIMAMVTPDDADRLAVPGGSAADTMHVTLGFLDKPAAEYDAATRAKLEQALAAIYPGTVDADAFAVATFNADNEPDDDHPPCTVLLVESQALADLHDAVGDVIDAITGVEESTDFPIWTPHVTLGYGLTPADVPAGRLGKLTLDRLVIGWGEDEHDLTPGK